MFYSRASIHTPFSFKERFFSIDFTLLFSVLILGVISIFAQFSSSGGNFDYFAKSHAIRFGVFFIFFILISFINVRYWNDYSLLIYFLNIFENNIKYSEPNKTIKIEALNFDKKLQVKIIDQGIGMAKEYIPRVTERFFRIDPEKSKSVGGTGLGLAIVKHIITQHRGDLRIESELGKGSTFLITLPKTI